jgi:hypothetical protein
MENWTEATSVNHKKMPVNMANFTLLSGLFPIYSVNNKKFCPFPPAILANYLQDDRNCQQF